MLLSRNVFALGLGLGGWAFNAFVSENVLFFPCPSVSFFVRVPEGLAINRGRARPPV